MLLEGKTALITGCRKGLGKETVLKFAQEGCAKIYAHARKETPELTAFLQDITEQYGTETEAVYFDMEDPEQIKTGLRPVIRRKTPLNILVNNAGIAHGGFLQMTKMDDIRRVFEINVFSHLEVVQTVIRKMSRTENGAIINIASIAGMDLDRGNCAYGSSKAAVIAETKTMSKEFAQYGIRVNAVSPGLLRTDMADQMEENAYADMVGGSLMNRLGEPHEVAAVIAFLASDEASFVNGQIIRVDGGEC